MPSFRAPSSSERGEGRGRIVPRGRLDAITLVALAGQRGPVAAERHQLSVDGQLPGTDEAAAAAREDLRGRLVAGGAGAERAGLEVAAVRHGEGDRVVAEACAR